MRLLSIVSAATLIGSLSTALASETTEVKQYTVKQSELNTGTNVLRTIINAGPVPLDKTYAELTNEQKEILKSGYEKMNAVDEPPFPAKGLMPILLVLRKAHEGSALAHKGILALNVKVGVDGKPVGYQVVAAPDASLVNAAATALMQQDYKPAHCNGAPCPMMYLFRAELTGPDERLLIGNEGQVKLLTRSPFK
jgi:hypothetical protein